MTRRSSAAAAEPQPSQAVSATFVTAPVRTWRLQVPASNHRLLLHLNRGLAGHRASCRRPKYGCFIVPGGGIAMINGLSKRLYIFQGCPRRPA